MNGNNGNDISSVEISFKDIISIIIKKIWWIILSMIICAAVAYVYAAYFIVPLYRTHVTFYINPLMDQTDVNVIVELQATNYAKNLVGTYIEILKTNSFKQKLFELSKEYLHDEINALDEINASVEFTEKPDTQLFIISVTSPSADDCYKLAEAVADAAPKTMIEIINSNTLKVIDYPVKKPESPINNNTIRNTLAGAFAGVALASCIAVLANIFDTRVKNEDDLKNHYNIPVLGEIADFNKVNKLNKKKNH